MAPCLPYPAGPRTSSHLRFLTHSLLKLSYCQISGVPHCCGIESAFLRIVTVTLCQSGTRCNGRHLEVSSSALSPTVYLAVLKFAQSKDVTFSFICGEGKCYDKTFNRKNTVYPMKNCQQAFHNISIGLKFDLIVNQT